METVQQREYLLPLVSGVDQLDNSEFDVTKNLLSKFNRISVREDTGIKIVEKMGYQAGWYLTLH
ncbi:hypothetical protein KHA80_12040 [Anaerobacillus sp. HL2]|nr:hypothetical protein KHA80_12040 [Anaerobacillus sp. HL2]